MNDEFKMTPAPGLMSDADIHHFWDSMSRFLGGVPLTNPETVVSGRTNELRKSHIIDLTKRYELVTTQLPTLFRMQQWEAVDLRTFDADPEGRWHLKGHGTSEQEAICNLLELIGAEVAKGNDRNELWPGGPTLPTEIPLDSKSTETESAIDDSLDRGEFRNV